MNMYFTKSIFLCQPQNILLTSESPLGDIKIVDFGLSRLVSSSQEIREIMGTPEYVGKNLFLNMYMWICVYVTHLTNLDYF